MRLLFFFVLCGAYLASLGAFDCKAQSNCYFIKAYDHQLWDDSGERVIVNHDGEIVVLGGGFTDTTDVIWLLWLDECGDTLKTRYYTLSLGSGGEVGSAISQNLDGSYSIHGYQYVQALGTSCSFLLRVAENGDSLDHQLYNIGVNDRTHASYNLGPKEFFGAGSYGNTLSSVFLFKTDSAGNLVWFNNYAGTYVNKLYDLELTSSGDFLLSGRTRDGQSSNLDLFLIKTDSMGNFAWRKVYGNTGREVLGHIDQFANDDVLLIGSYQPDELITSHLKTLLIRVDSSGGQLWRKESDNTKDAISHNDGIILSDQQIITVGTLVEEENINKGYFVINKLKEDGSLIWSRKHELSSAQDEALDAREVIQTDNGDFLVVGLYFSSLSLSNTRNDLLIIKTDSCGYSAKDTTQANFELDSVQGSQAWLKNLSTTTCSQLWLFGDGDSSTFWNPIHTYPDTGDYTVTLITRAANTTDTLTKVISVRPNTTAGLGLRMISNTSIHVYPNPASNYVYLNLPDKQPIDFQLYNLAGVTVLNKQLSSSTSIDVSTLQPGVYVYQFKSSTTNHYGKLIVE